MKKKNEEDEKKNRKVNKEERAKTRERRLIKKKRRKSRKERSSGNFGIGGRKREIGKEVERKKKADNARVSRAICKTKFGIQDVISPYSLDQFLISNTPRTQKHVKKVKKSKDSQIVVSI